MAIGYQPAFQGAMTPASMMPMRTTNAMPQQPAPEPIYATQGQAVPSPQVDPAPTAFPMSGGIGGFGGQPLSMLFGGGMRPPMMPPMFGGGMRPFPFRPMYGGGMQSPMFGGGMRPTAPRPTDAMYGGMRPPMRPMPPMFGGGMRPPMFGGGMRPPMRPMPPMRPPFGGGMRPPFRPMFGGGIGGFMRGFA